jgi:threonine aldolase
MYDAEVGDDVWNEDPTVHRLEEYSAGLTGMEAGLFVASGTQGNLIGLLAHTQPGNEVILGDQSHIFWYEVAGAAVVGGLQFHTLPNGTTGKFTPQQVAAAIRTPDSHFPVTGCVAIENSHNRCGGAVWTPEEMSAVAEVAHVSAVPVHLDGARVFNAAVALGLEVSAITESVDSVTFCLSKGLGAPVGSVLCGTREYIQRAHRWRKLLGGGMRQVGILAAAGLFALEHNVGRLAEDHANARRLAEGLSEIDGITVDPAAVQSNIVFFDVEESLDPVRLVEDLLAEGVRISGGGRRMRAVISYEVSADDIEYALSTLARVTRQAASALS